MACGAQQPVDQGAVADVSGDEGMPGRIGQVGQVVFGAGVGQRVEGNDARAVVLAEPVMDVIGADETGPAGDEQ